MLPNRRAVLAVLVVCSLGFAAAPTLAAEETDAGDFLRSLSEKAFAKLSDETLSKEQKQQNFRDLFREGFDLPAISRFVLGKYWRQADAAQQQAFMDAFEELHMRRFLPLFAEYSNDMITVRKIHRDETDPNMYLVNSAIARPSGEPISVDWRIRDEGKRYKVLDIFAEGVSMAISLRHEYGAVAKNQGVDGLIKEMRGKIAELAAQ